MGLRNSKSHAFSIWLQTVLAISALGSVACSRETSVYSDPKNEVLVSVEPDWMMYALPKDFSNHSVNRAVVTTATNDSTKNLRFQTWAGAGLASQFNGAGTGNRAILGLESWNGRPVSHVEPMTFDAKTAAGTEALGVALQIDVHCDGTEIYVVKAAGADIAMQPSVAQTDGFSRYQASINAPIWSSGTIDIVDPDTSAILVPAGATRVSLADLLLNYPAACLKNALTTAQDFPKGVPTSAVLWTLGTDQTTGDNTVLVRRLSVGSEVFEGLE